MNTSTNVPHNSIRTTALCFIDIKKIKYFILPIQKIMYSPYMGISDIFSENQFSYYANSSLEIFTTRSIRNKK